MGVPTVGTRITLELAEAGPLDLPARSNISGGPWRFDTPCRVIRIPRRVQIVQRSSETTSFGWGTGWVG